MSNISNRVDRLEDKHRSRTQGGLIVVRECDIRDERHLSELEEEAQQTGRILVTVRHFTLEDIENPTPTP